MYVFAYIESFVVIQNITLSLKIRFVLYISYFLINKNFQENYLSLIMANFPKDIFELINDNIE